MLPVSPAKLQALLSQMKRLGIEEGDLEETFVRSSGAGGQNVNKVSTCVVLFHRSSGTEVKCQKTRSQALNRYYARKILCEKLEQKILGERSAIEQKREKIRRQKRKRSKRAKEKMLENKKHQSLKKMYRSKKIDNY